MTHTNLNLAQLARYLHLPDKKVQKLVEQGNIPGRKVQGEWVFAKEEIHRWLETRIGLCDAEQLVEVEDALARSAPTTEEQTVYIAELLHPSAIAVPLKARTRDSVIRDMTKLAEQTGLLWDAAKIAEAVKSREDLHSTALDNGVALLHPRRPMPAIVGETFLSLGITAGGVPFGGGFGNLTDVFFLILSTDDRIHLRVLARLSRLLTMPEFLPALRRCGSPNEVLELVEKLETTM